MKTIMIKLLASLLLLTLFSCSNSKNYKWVGGNVMKGHYFYKQSVMDTTKIK